MKRLLIAGLLLLAMPLGCTTRDRSNPLDPHNARTGGAIPGFNAVAANGVVELRWIPLAQSGVIGYRVERWTPGTPPLLLGVSDYGPLAVAAEDQDVVNDTTYVYRLIAHLASGDSAVSAPDSATPGTRRIVALGAETTAFAGFSPDLRDEIFGVGAASPYQDMELDRKSGTVWLVADFLTGGEVVRYLLNGTALPGAASISRPTDLSIGATRGIAWVASPDAEAVLEFSPTSPDPSEIGRVFGVGHPLVVEAGSIDPSVWVGSREGVVYRVRPTDLSIVGSWDLGASIRAIAMDEAAGAAWVAVRTDPRFHDLYRITEQDSAFVRVRSGLDNVADLAVDPRNGDLWVSERGVPNAGSGRLSRLSPGGAVEMSVGSLEPYGLDVDLKDGTCWVTDLRSNRVLHVAKDGSILAASPALPVPYAVRVQVP